MSTWFFPSALVEGRIAHNVRVQSQNGVITAVTIGAEPHRHTFDGVAVPGFANTHSHIFHRGLRGAGEGEDFWSWRTENVSTSQPSRPRLLLPTGASCLC